MTKELIQNLRSVGRLWEDEAADALEAQQHELRVKDLTIGKMANDMAAAQAEIAHWKNNHETEVRRARILKERTDMPIERVQAYEKWGEDQRTLAASQVQIKVLRDALDNCRLFAARRRAEEWATHILRFCESGGSVANPLRQDDSALREMLKAERERCAKVCETQTDALSCADAIRVMGSES